MVEVKMLRGNCDLPHVAILPHELRNPVFDCTEGLGRLGGYTVLYEDDRVRKIVLQSRVELQGFDT